MFSSALKSFSSNITSNYTLSPNPTSRAGPWKIHDAKKKSTGKTVSVFVFDRKALDPHSGLSRSSGASMKKIHDEAIDRLKKEASSLARLRHPSILELVEPVEETRSGGLMFATEQVTASLAGLLEEKDAQERAGGVGGRASRYVIEDADGGGRRRRDLEIDELEIQKGLLQMAKALEFLHESAGLVHGNFTPEAVFINAKSDWKLSGLAFSGPPDNPSTPTSVAPISLSEVLHHDPRLPRSVQLNLDYSSPDFVMDATVTPSADIFSLGLVIVALYNSPHVSPLQTNSSASTYKRLFSSSSTTPTQHNQFLSSRPIPKDLTATVLPRMIARRPAQRMTAREFQQSQYFDNILVSSIRFLDSLPAKTPNEKSQFMRGLGRVLPQFPKPVLEKKVLPALLEEFKDRDLLSLILPNIFKIIQMLPSGRRAFTERALPRLKEVFLTTTTSTSAPLKGAASERDTGKEAGLMIILENMPTVIESCSAKDFKNDVLPILNMAIDSTNHALVDASFRSLPTVLPALDFSTIKNELFPKVAAVFTKTSSLGIKVRGLEAFTVLCGGSSAEQSSTEDGLNGIISGPSSPTKKTGTTALDKYTVQEKVIPLLKAIKTKEPAVMMAALNVLRQVGRIADYDFVAMDVLPLLWTMGLGPLLNLQQFQSFMDLIKQLSGRVEQEQTRKLQEMSSTSASESRIARTDDIMSFTSPSNGNGVNGGNDDDFERLVLGKQTGNAGGSDAVDGDWNSAVSKASNPQPGTRSDTPVFSWSTPAATSSAVPYDHRQSLRMGTLTPQASSSRSITPDLSSFTTLTPSSSSTQPLAQPLQPQTQQASNWSSSPWNGQRTTSSPSLATLGSMNTSKPLGMTTSTSAFSTLPPHSSTTTLSSSTFAAQPSPYNAFSIPPPPSMASAQSSRPGMGVPSAATTTSAFAAANSTGGALAPKFGNMNLGGGGSMGGLATGSAPMGKAPQQKTGLDQYESLL
ncbi:MAG: hypothetical protein M1838_002982 [Thelocarpon superellum]|nr:MAG: hypothetical protein M1838_002982 [Thelocarpon superellum]